MIAALHHLTMMQHENHVSVGDRAETVGDRYGRSACHQYVERSMDFGLDFAIDCTGRLVEQQQRCIGGNGSREREKLSLTYADRCATLPQHLAITLGKTTDDAVRPDSGGCAHN